MAEPSKLRPSCSILVALLICVGLILRSYNFWGPPIWVDEYGTWWVIAADTWSEVIERTLKIQGQSPFYYLLVRGVTELAGYGAFQLRLLSVVFGIATLALVYPLATKIFDSRRVALLSVAIFALSEPLIWYSQIARPYALALFFSLVSFWSFVSLQQAETKSVRIIYAFSTALTIYAHYLFGSIVVIQAIYMIARSGYRRMFSIRWLATFLSMALLLYPAIQNFLYLHSRRRALDWVSSLDSSWKIAGGIIYILGGAPPIAIIATILTVAVVGFNWAKLKRTEIRSQLTLPILWYVLPFILFLIVPILVGVNLLQPRYLLFAYPATFFLLAWLMLNVRASGYRRWLPATVFAIATVITVFIPALNNTQTFARWPNRAWSDALAKLAQLYKADGIVVGQIGLVEADLLADNRYDPMLFSYLSWPLVTAVPMLSEQNIAILPYRLTDGTQIYFSSLLDRAIKHPRIWLVGGGEVLSLFQERLMRSANFNVTLRTDHGEAFHVILLERTTL